MTNVLTSQTPPVHLEARDLTVEYRTRSGMVRALDGVSFDLGPGRSLGLVGESGCGKSTAAKAILRLLPETANVTGAVLLDGEDVLQMSESRLRQVRWTKMALIAQSAMNALDPVYRIGSQIAESIRAHRRVSKRKAWARAGELLQMVGIDPVRLRDYPHQLSGGMRQRVVIATALSLEAGLLVADEPTTALDAIRQDQILGKVKELQQSLHRSMILITHDIAVVAENCDEVAVMYAGRIMEIGPTKEVLSRPFHPYTMGLRNAFPSIEAASKRLISIPGNLPDRTNLPAGCGFAARCPFASDICRTERPPLIDVGRGQKAACHFTDRAERFRVATAEPETWEAKSA